MSEQKKKANASMLDQYYNLQYKCESIATFYCQKIEGIDVPPMLEGTGKPRIKN